ncbi:MAG: sugar phosphate nucleotidyltransferase [Candidatus Binatia bacterium]
MLTLRDPRYRTDTWALVLAGGDGTRLRAITRLLAGEPIPKQYCRITGARSMLEATLDRVAPLVPPQRTMVIVNHDHLRLAVPQLAGIPGENVLVQPRNRDTGPGIAWSLLEIRRRHPNARVAMFPSDHYVADDAAFRASVRRALAVVDRHPGKLALLGIEPDDPSPEYGYVMPAARLDGGQGDAFHVASFREKPTPAVAAALVRAGGLWNSFVMAFRVPRVLALLEQRLPATLRTLDVASRLRDTLERHYATEPGWNFSNDFLSTVAAELVVVRAEQTGWSDWGTPTAIERTFAALKRVPPWHAAPAHAGRLDEARPA